MNTLENILLQTKARLEKVIANHKYWLFTDFCTPLTNWLSDMKDKQNAGTYKLGIAEYNEDYKKMLMLEGQFKTHKKRLLSEKYKRELLDAERELNGVKTQLCLIENQKEAKK